MRYLLYNSLSGKANLSYESAKDHASKVKTEKELLDMTKIKSLSDFLRDLNDGDDVVVFGGDGTLNKIINALPLSCSNDIYYYPCGTGNDFARDTGAISGEPILINDYLKNLPTVSVSGKQYKFINGVGFGIDGYCCAVGDELKRKNKNPNYTSIAIEGLLFHFKPVNAKVTVDGVTQSFNKVWLAPTMYGRYYGGGMMPTPSQDRNATEKNLSLMVFHETGKLKTLMIFPSLFKGEHIEHKKHVSVLVGKKITVEFDRPTPLQIDGETILDVRSYTASV